MQLSKQALIALGIVGAGMLSAEPLTREQLNTLLDSLAARPVPAQETLRMGAMCYEPVGIPMRSEYVCLVCNTKTLYEVGKEGGREKIDAAYVIEELPRRRKQIEEINTLNVTAQLDETDLCSHCQRDKDKAKPGLYFVVSTTTEDGKEKTIRTLLTYGDLPKLIACLKKQDRWVGENDGEYPLKPELPRIRELLGLDEKGKGQ